MNLLFMENKRNHILYNENDKNVPACIKDTYGDIVLSMCKICGKAESDLDQDCKPIIEQYKAGQDVVIDHIKYSLKKANQKEFKEFDPELFKAYINKFNPEDKIKALKVLIEESSIHYVDKQNILQKIETGLK